MTSTPIPLASLRAEVPWWPFSRWYTAKMIRQHKLGCIRLGRRVFVSEEILRDYVAAHVIRP